MQLFGGSSKNWWAGDIRDKYDPTWPNETDVGTDHLNYVERCVVRLQFVKLMMTVYDDLWHVFYLKYIICCENVGGKVCLQGLFYVCAIHKTKLSAALKVEFLLSMITTKQFTSSHNVSLENYILVLT